VVEGRASPGQPISAVQFENPRTLLMLGREPFRVDLNFTPPGGQVDYAAIAAS
jgi:hypothetical protein